MPAARDGVDAALERTLVLELVHNEQHFIEQRVVHSPRFRAGQQWLAMIESSVARSPWCFRSATRRSAWASSPSWAPNLARVVADRALRGIFEDIHAPPERDLAIREL